MGESGWLVTSQELCEGDTQMGRQDVTGVSKDEFQFWIVVFV